MPVLQNEITFGIIVGADPRMVAVKREASPRLITSAVIFSSQWLTPDSRLYRIRNRAKVIEITKRSESTIPAKVAVVPPVVRWEFLQLFAKLCWLRVCGRIRQIKEVT